MAYDEALADRIRAAISGTPGLTEKLMFGGIAFLVGGHMALGVARDRLMVRFDPARHEEVMRRAGAGPMDFHKRPGGMRGMAFVDQASIPTEVALAAWAELALAFVTKLPRKPEGRTTASAKTRPLTRAPASSKTERLATKSKAKAPASKANAPASKAKAPASKAKAPAKKPSR